MRMVIDTPRERDREPLPNLLMRLKMIETPAVLVVLTDELTPRVEEFKDRVTKCTPLVLRVTTIGTSHLRVVCTMESYKRVQDAVIKVLVEMG